MRIEHLLTNNKSLPHLFHFLNRTKRLKHIFGSLTPPTQAQPDPPRVAVHEAQKICSYAAAHPRRQTRIAHIFPFFTCCFVSQSCIHPSCLFHVCPVKSCHSPCPHYDSPYTMQPHPCYHIDHPTQLCSLQPPVMGPALTYDITVHFQSTRTHITHCMYGLPQGATLRTLNMDLKIYIYIVAGQLSQKGLQMKDESGQTQNSGSLKTMHQVHQHLQ